MNDELDVLGRVVDYHDHISAPAVPVTDDLLRGRRRVRRNRGLLAGGVALGVVSVVATASLFTGEGSVDSPQPIGPPATETTSDPVPDNSGLTTPLVAPGSVLDVRALGFHVEPVPGLGEHHAGWSLDERSQSVELDWDHMAEGVTVSVYYQGVVPTFANMTRGDDVTVHGVPGQYYATPGRPTPGEPWGALLLWKYAEDAYATVYTGSAGRVDPDPEPVRATLIKVAEAVRPGGQAVRLPIRFGAIPSSLPDPATAGHVISGTGDGDWDVQLFQAGLGIIITTADGPAQAGDDTSVEDDGDSLTVTVRVGDTVRQALVDGAVRPPGFPIADLKLMLREITVAPSNDPSTWFDLRTALGG